MENHYFIACALSDQAKEALHNVRQSYLNENWFKKIPHQADLHVTLSFLGAVSEGQLHIVSEALDKKIKACSTFPLTFSRVDTFGPDASPRVWWAGPDDSDELTVLYSQVQDAVRLINQAENRPFRPHATLAKKWKSGQHLDPVYKGRINPITDTIQEVTIYEIYPGEAPMYKVYQSFKLKESGEKYGTAD